MITEEEFENIQVGDYIQIVDEWNENTCENPYGDMNYLLGHLFMVSQEPNQRRVLGDFVLKTSIQI